jgi:hypothetical protein
MARNAEREIHALSVTRKRRYTPKKRGEVRPLRTDPTVSGAAKESLAVGTEWTRKRTARRPEAPLKRSRAKRAVKRCCLRRPSRGGRSLRTGSDRKLFRHLMRGEPIAWRRSTLKC